MGKSKLLIFSNKLTPKDAAAESGIFINGEMLKEVDHAKYLGALIDNKLVLSDKCCRLKTFQRNWTSS